MHLKEAFAVHYADPSKITSPPPRLHTLPILSSTFSITQSTPALSTRPPSSITIISEPHSTLSTLPSPPGVPHVALVGAPDESYRSQPITIPLQSGRAESGVSFVARAPTSRFIKPTTLKGTTTRIRISHSLVTEVQYRVLKDTSDGLDIWGDLKTLGFSSPVVVAAVSSHCSSERRSHC